MPEYRDWTGYCQILYGSDDLSGEWDHRNWSRHRIRERLFTLAAEACLRM